MKNILSKKNRSVLQSLGKDSLLAFDFDGTLAAIVRDPQKAKLKPSTKLLLEQLSQQGPIAIISGRAVNDLVSRAPIKASFLLGNHGIEGSKANTKALLKAKKLSQSWNAKLRSHFEIDPLPPGIEIENKQYSLSLHYRKSKNPRLAKACIEALIAKLRPPPEVIGGKCVYNLIAPGAPDKGKALQRLIKEHGFKQVLFVGDDDTDESIFALHDSKLLSIRVGRKKDSMAKYFIPKQADIDDLLTAILKTLMSKSAAR